mgnify:CR=1 FL=1
MSDIFVFQSNELERAAENISFWKSKLLRARDEYEIACDARKLWKCRQEAIASIETPSHARVVQAMLDFITDRIGYVTDETLETRRKLVADQVLEVRRAQDAHRKIRETTRRGFDETRMAELIASNDSIISGAVSDREISVVFAGLKCTPRYNPIKFINGGNKVTFNLPNVEVSVLRNNFAPRMAPSDTDYEDLPMYYEKKRTVHPHVLEDVDPCLGTFGDSLSDLAHKGDFESYFTVCQMFLETADPDDSAGTLWWSAILPEETAYDEKGDEADGYYFIIRREFTNSFNYETFEGKYWTVEDGVITQHCSDSLPEPEHEPEPSTAGASNPLLDDIEEIVTATGIPPIPMIRTILLRASDGGAPVLRVDPQGYVIEVLHPDFVEVEYVLIHNRAHLLIHPMEQVILCQYGSLPDEAPRQVRVA